MRREWLGKPVTQRVAVYEETVPVASAKRPRAYWIPAQWSEIAEKLKMHGIAVERIDAAREVGVEMYRLVDPKLDSKAFEGHVVIETLGVTMEKRTEKFPAGSYRVSPDQPLGDLAMLMLEPQSPDSFLRWGYFHSILQRTEYSEAYVIEALAEEMLRDPKVAQEFEKKLESDAAFRADPTARLAWFYARSPYYDERWLLYPIAREPFAP